MHNRHIQSIMKHNANFISVLHENIDEESAFARYYKDFNKDSANECWKIVTSYKKKLNKAVELQKALKLEYYSNLRVENSMRELRKIGVTPEICYMTSQELENFVRYFEDLGHNVEV